MELIEDCSQRLARANGLAEPFVTGRMFGPLPGTDRKRAAGEPTLPAA